MNALKKPKNLITIAAVILVIILAVAFFRKKPSATALTAQNATSSASVNGQNAVGKELLSLLLQLKSLSLDEKIFQNESFISLKDFGKEIVSQPGGRKNPFAPISLGDLIQAPISTTTVSNSRTLVTTAPTSSAPTSGSANQPKGPAVPR